MSVTCPFTRMSESKVYSRNGTQPLKTVMQYTQEDYKILDTLAEISFENFEAKYETIEKLIIAKNMGRNENPELKDQLVLLKRICTYLRQATTVAGQGSGSTKDPIELPPIARM